MRRQTILWAFLVLAIVLTGYGGYSVFFSLGKGEAPSILAVAFFIAGGLMLVTWLTLFLISFFQQKKKAAKTENAEAVQKFEPEPVPEPKEEPKAEPKEEKPAQPVEPKPRPSYTYDKDVTYERSAPVRRPRGGSAYVKRVGYGPVLRVEGNDILDMRSNTYYRIDGDTVNRSGSGPAFEISGNRIRAAFGSYLYEISGNNVNKVFGGYFASIDEDSIQTVDLSQRYEISGSLNRTQKLAVVALLFGSY